MNWATPAKSDVKVTLRRLKTPIGRDFVDKTRISPILRRIKRA